MKTLLASCAILLFSAFQVAAFDTRATAAFVMDQTTGTVLLNKNGDEPLPPASMSKLMTLYMTFEAVAEGRLTLDETLPVSQRAADLGGSTMFLDTRDRVSVEDLIRGIIVLSGNDACVVLAEALSPDGTEAGFARMMTARGKEMGMEHSTFTNSTGWPQAGHRMSMQDLAILADRLITDYPTYYPLFAEREFLFDGRAPQNKNNRNPLLSLDIGADGLKTGHTQEAGYGLVGSAKQGDRRVIFSITGLETVAERAEESERIVTWAFRQFVEKEAAKSGSLIAEADVWMGNQTKVGLTVADDLTLLVPILGASSVNAYAEYDGPFEAPIEAGQELGQLVIEVEGLPELRRPLVADRDITRGGIMPRLRAAVTVLLRDYAGISLPDAI